MTERVEQAEQAKQSAPAPPLLLCVLVPCVLWASMWLMMASHESGHVIGTLVTGGGIDHLELSPLTFSQTHTSPNPKPLLVVWAGPIVGVLDPLLAWLLVTWLKRRDPSEWRGIEAVFTFLAGFCLLANGAYLGLGWIDRVGDTGEMMRLGTPISVMIGVGLACMVGGLALWHRLGPWLGLKGLSRIDAQRLLIASLVVLAVGFVVGAVL